MHPWLGDSALSYNPISIGDMIVSSLIHPEDPSSMHLRPTHAIGTKKGVGFDVPSGLAHPRHMAGVSNLSVYGKKTNPQRGSRTQHQVSLGRLRPKKAIGGGPARASPAHVGPPPTLDPIKTLT